MPTFRLYNDTIPRLDKAITNAMEAPRYSPPVSISAGSLSVISVRCPYVTAQPTGNGYFCRGLVSLLDYRFPYAWCIASVYCVNAR